MMMLMPEDIIDDLPEEEQVTLLDFLGELKHIHFGKPVHLDEVLFSDDDSDNENESEMNELGSEVGKPEVSKIQMTSDDRGGAKIQEEEGPDPPNYIPSPPKRDNFLESLILRASTHHNKIIKPADRNITKPKTTKASNGSFFQFDKREEVPEEQSDLPSKPKPLPRPPSLRLSMKLPSPKFQLFEKPVLESAESPPLSPISLSVSAPVGTSGEKMNSSEDDKIKRVISTPALDDKVGVIIKNSSPLNGPIPDAKEEVGGVGKDISVNDVKIENTQAVEQEVIKSDKMELNEGQIDLLEFLTDINNTTLIKQEASSMAKEKKFEDLPLSIRQKCRDLKIDMKLINKHMDLFWRIAYFLYREDFPVPLLPLSGSLPVKEIYASETIFEHGKSEVKFPPKALKKLFKGGNLTGEGGYGKVFVSKDTTRRDTIAIKKVAHLTPKNKETNYSEVGFLSSCNHPNIVTFYTAYLNINTKKGIEEVWIITEYLQGGTLAEAAKNYEFKEKHVRFVAKEILQALVYLHKRGWAHRDLKSPNIMISLDGQVKLIDFGLCADMSKGERTKLLGSAFWIPPEMINRLPHHLSADIWSFGVCVLELFLRGPPYAHSALLCMFKVAISGLQSLIPSKLSEHPKDFLQKCLTIDREQRPTAEQLLEHDWIKQQPCISRADFALITRGIFMAHAIDSLLV